MALIQGSVRARKIIMITAGLMACAGILTITAAFAADAPTTNPDSAISRSTEDVAKESYWEKVGNRLGSLDIKLKLKLLDIDWLDGLKTGLNYRYELEPSYTGEYHLRTDRIQLNTDINVGELLNHPQKYVGLELSHGTEMVYVRPFKNKGDAAKAFPFGFDRVPRSAAEILSRLPLDAQNVIDNFQPGDFFSFTAHLDLVVGASSLPITSSMPAQVFTHYLVSGQYRIYLVKGRDKHLIMRIVALRKDEKSFGVTAGFPEGHKIIGMKVVDRRIEAVSNVTEMFKVAMAKMTSNLLMVSYDLNLESDRVKDAYNAIVSNVFRFNTIQIANPLTSKSELTSKLLSDVTPLETIFEEERSKPVEQRLVDRRFKGKNDVDVSDSSSFKIAPIIFKFTKETEYFENQLTSTKADGSKEFYRLHTFQRTLEKSWWFSYYKATSISSAALLFDSNSKLDIGPVRDIAFSWNYRDKALTAKELRMVKDAVRQSLPSRIHKTVNWGAFNVEQEYANARVVYKMLLNENALGRVASLDAAQIHALLDQYIDTIPAPAAEPGNYGNQGPNDGVRPMRVSMQDKYRETFENIAYHLANVFKHDPRLKDINDPALLAENKRRADAFAELRFNDLFIEIGPGFLLSLLPDNELEKLVHFEVTLVADKVPGMSFVFPPKSTVPDRPVYQAASLIQSILVQNEFETITQLMKEAGPVTK